MATEEVNDFNSIQAIIEATVVTVAERFGQCLKANDINKDILFCPDELAMRFRGEKTDRKITTDSNGKIVWSDKYVLDFINLWVEDIKFSWDRQRTAPAREGVAVGHFNITEPAGKEFVEVHKAMPVDMRFTMTYWTKYKTKMDAFIQQFIFWQQEDSIIELYYDENKKVEFHVAIGDIADDSMSIRNMFREGKYWRHTYAFVLQAWIFRGIPYRSAKKIVLDIYAVAEIPVPAVDIPSANVYHEEIVP